MATEWYYKVMGQEFGPVSGQRLKEEAVAGRLTTDSFVRKGKGGAWVGARRVNGLFSEPAPTPKSPAVDEDFVQSVLSGPEPNDKRPSKTITKACPYCGETILAVAKKCKHCAEFLDEEIGRMSHDQGSDVALPNEQGGPAPVLVEQTAKIYKLIQLGGVLCSLVFAFVCVLGAFSGRNVMMGVGMWCFFAGLGIFSVGRFLAWWHHG